ncbi:MAG: hypothetical protein D6677_00550 [Calditrichaeota bacterium]|nr:MAG: hypothetical protein D6677_00550 [Calditrichota bacterium]
MRLFILSVWALASFCFAQNTTQTVTATGYGAILAGDKVKAREDAVNDALRKAVEQVVGMMIDASTVSENYMVIEDKIYSQTTGYVQSYNVLSEQERADHSLEVTVSAVVKQGDLKSDLEGILTILRREGMPRLMVLISEENSGSAGMTGGLNSVETALMNTMMQYGFPFVDAATMKRNLNASMAVAAMNGDTQAAAEIARQTGAEVLILGNARSSVTQLAIMKNSGMKSCNANLNLRAVRADDAVIIATSSQHAVVAHIDEQTGSEKAFAKAAARAGEELKNKIVEKFRKNQFSARQIQLEVINISSFSQLNTLKNNLPYYIRGIKNIYQRSFGNGRALFDIEITQKAESVAAELSAKEIEGVRLDITGMTQNKLTARIK